jgi:hypothetical protein
MTNFFQSEKFLNRENDKKTPVKSYKQVMRERNKWLRNNPEEAKRLKEYKLMLSERDKLNPPTC